MRCQQFLEYGIARGYHCDRSYLFAGIISDAAVFPWWCNDEVTCGDIVIGSCCECGKLSYACVHVRVCAYVGSEYLTRFKFWIVDTIISTINITITM